jgi:hypothetical protein
MTARNASPLAFAVAVGLMTHAARAHDPFEITVDGHVSGEVLTVRTVMSLSTAARACLNAARLPRSAFETERPRLLACATGLLELQAGGETLKPRSIGVAVGVEDELELRTDLARPRRGPLRLTARGLAAMDPSAGVTATFTGERSVLGQKVLRADDPTLTMPINADCEAPGTPALEAAVPQKPRAGRNLHPLLGGGLAALGLVILAALRRLRSAGAAAPTSPPI